MCAEDNLAAVADSLDDDIVVAGPSEAVTEQATSDDQPRVVETEDVDEVTAALRDVSVVVVALSGSESEIATTVGAVGGMAGFTVAVLDGQEDDPVDPSLLDTVSEAVDVTLLACGRRPAGSSLTEQRDENTAQSRQTSSVAVDGAFDFVRMIRESGEINLDLADARTVLSGGAPAVLGGAGASLDTQGSKRAMQRAFDAIPDTIETTRGSAAMVSVVGGPTMSVDDATAAVQAVRAELWDVDELIWGVATDDALSEQMTVDVIVDDVIYRPPLSAGDPCRRCGTALVGYTMGEQTTLACENCGFADLSTSLDDRSDHDATT